MRTLVGVVLDRSGSMSSVLNDTIGGFNSFVEDQREKQLDQVYVLTQFDTEYEVLQDGVDLDDVIVLSNKNYIPRGGTALLDAMGQTIHRMDAILANDKTIKQAILVVLTDGEENMSREFTRDQVFKLIEDREQQNWSFAFLGAAQDAIGQARSLGINNAHQYVAGSGLSCQRAFHAASVSTANYSAGGSADFANNVK